MGKGGDTKSVTSESTATSSASYLDVTNNDVNKTIYTWEEVRKHNKRDDCWIVVNDNVYNMTNFKYKHPGGSKIIDFYGGQDATVIYIQF